VLFSYRQTQTEPPLDAGRKYVYSDIMRCVMAERGNISSMLIGADDPKVFLEHRLGDSIKFQAFLLVILRYASV
jgi:hypothetical protein